MNTFRSKVSIALGKAQNYTGEIIIGLCRASDENHDAVRLELLTDAREDALKILQAIDEAIVAEQPVRVVA